MHYFQSYAVRDRIDLTGYDDTPPPRPVQWTMENYKSVAEKVLPTPMEESVLAEHFVQLVARVMVQKMPYFNQFEGVMPTGIEHKFSEEMSQKSETVGLNS